MRAAEEPAILESVDARKVELFFGLPWLYESVVVIGAILWTLPLSTLFHLFAESLVPASKFVSRSFPVQGRLPISSNANGQKEARSKSPVAQEARRVSGKD